MNPASRQASNAATAASTDSYHHPSSKKVKSLPELMRARPKVNGVTQTTRPMAVRKGRMMYMGQTRCLGWRSAMRSSTSPTASSCSASAFALLMRPSTTASIKRCFAASTRATCSSTVSRASK